MLSGSAGRCSAARVDGGALRTKDVVHQVRSWPIESASISTFRHLAHNVVASIRKGEHVLITGRLRVRDWENADRNGTSVEIEADSIGHDLTWCTTSYVRSAPPSTRAAEQRPAEPDDAGEPPAESEAFPESEPMPAPRADDGFLPREAPSLVALDS